MKVYDAVANAFVKEGVSTIFGLLGDGQITWWSAMSQYAGVQFVDVRDEGAALTMAEGWAMVTGKVGVCSATHGPGLSRMTTSLITATRSRSPIVVYTSKTPFNNEGNSQFLNQERLVNATDAGYIEVLKPDYAEEAVRQAFYRARLESRPIVLCVPVDIQTKECDSDGADYQPSSTLFSGQQRIRPDVERLQDALDIIAACKKPVIILGRGAMEPDVRLAADRLAKRIGALITTSLIAKGLLGDSEYHTGISGLFSAREVMPLFADADCVIAIGASLNARTLEGGYLYPKARFIQIDVLPHVMMGNDRGADCYIQGDAAVTTDELERKLGEQGFQNDGYRTAAVRQILRDTHRDPAEFEILPGTLDPREAIRVLDEQLPSNIALVMGSGHSFAFSVLGMKKARPLHVFITAFGCIGQTLPAAIGIGVALDGKPLVHLSGDGGTMQTIQELDTASRLGVKVLFVILNDEAYGAEYHRLKAKGLNANLSVVRSPDFGRVGRAFGCRGRLAATLEDVAAGVDEFLSGEGPMVLDVRLSRNVPSVSHRRLHLGQDV